MSLKLMMEMQMMGSEGLDNHSQHVGLHFQKPQDIGLSSIKRDEILQCAAAAETSIHKMKAKKTAFGFWKVHYM